MDEWDFIKKNLVRAGLVREVPYTEDVFEEELERKMAVALVRDRYGYCQTIFVSLCGSPPRAFAVISLRDSIEPDGLAHVRKILVLDGELRHYKTMIPYNSSSVFWLVDTKKLLDRDDVVVMNEKDMIKGGA